LCNSKDMEEIIAWNPVTGRSIFLPRIEGPITHAYLLFVAHIATISPLATVLSLLNILSRLFSLQKGPQNARTQVGGETFSWRLPSVSWRMHGGSKNAFCASTAFESLRSKIHIDFCNDYNCKLKFSLVQFSPTEVMWAWKWHKKNVYNALRTNYRKHSPHKMCLHCIID
jgi:hypothetical protein